jgi:putative CocE/NonD family hydrolase
VLFENGAGKAPFQPYPGYEQGFSEFPPKNNVQRSWYLGSGGKLSDKRGGSGADKFTWDAGARPLTNFTGDTGSGNLWTDHPTYEWSQPVAGKSVSYVTEPMSEDTTVLGSGEVELWVQSKAKNVDLQATVSEVRPDDKETFVQGGWLRTSARKMDKGESSLGNPVPTLKKKDAKTLPKGKYVKVRVPLYYQGHTYREGSQIRVTIQAPGGDQPTWAFENASTDPKGKPWVAIAHDKKHPSRLVLPVTPGVEAPTELPGCPALRGEPCRDYAPVDNKSFKG